MSKPQQMKWWGWGEEDKKFDVEKRPKVKPYIMKHFRKTSVDVFSPVQFGEIDVPEAKTNPAFLDELLTLIPEARLDASPKARVVHAYGKSYRDLYRIRRGQIESAPDLVVYPENEAEVVHILAAANKYEIAVIPFGGGSNIAGSVEVTDRDRMTVCIDLKLMNQVLSVDPLSQTARIQGGALGPVLEEQLKDCGFQLGHLPDSFMHSTLGGWIASRSSGMQSDLFGNIEDMVLSINLVTPQGMLKTTEVPRSAVMDLKQMIFGSEGAMGIITEATVRVRPFAEVREFHGFLFNDFSQGVKSIFEMKRRGLKPLLVRLNDPFKTALSFNFKEKSSGLEALAAKAGQKVLATLKGVDFDNCSLLIVGFEGSKKSVKKEIAQVRAICKANGGPTIGNALGKTFEKTKYDFPYVRDFAMDHGLITDVSETSVPWSKLIQAYTGIKARLEKALAQTQSIPWVGCHVSHTYDSGASLYFTFIGIPHEGKELESYLYVKQALQEAFIEQGLTLSHHHGVGYEHGPWLDKDIGSLGTKVLQSVKVGVDPSNIMNPGKLQNQSLAEWGLQQDDIDFFNGLEPIH